MAKIKREYISKDYVLYLTGYYGSMLTWSTEDIISEIKRKIKEEPAADVQSVIRCKNCKFYTDNINDPNLRNGFCNRIEQFAFDKRKPEDFCSYGQKAE